jgi:hypothetical protein
MNDDDERAPDAVDGEPGAPEARLSKGLAALWTHGVRSLHYDVVIVGSGYGGSAAAQALAGAKVTETGETLKVCVLERGSEYLPGEFPSRFGELPGHVRLAQQNTGRVRGAHRGLFDLRLGDDVAVLVANGLGGGSLINAGVMLEPRLADFDEPAAQAAQKEQTVQDPQAPAAAADPDDPDGQLEPPAADTARTQLRTLVRGLKQGGYFERARRLLGAVVNRQGAWQCNTIRRHPDVEHQPLRKTVALASVAPKRPFRRPPITVAMDQLPNSGGVKLNRCTLCGDCSQ